MKKNIPYIFMCLIILLACNRTKKISLHGPHAIKGTVYGDSILDNNVRDLEAVMAISQSAKTVKLKVKGTVVDVCKDEGGWITLALPNKEVMMVYLKNHGYFVPKNIKGKEVVIDGELKTETISVEEQRKIAKQNGLNQKEIERITAAKNKIAFDAKGLVVL